MPSPVVATSKRSEALPLRLVMVSITSPEAVATILQVPLAVRESQVLSKAELLDFQFILIIFVPSLPSIDTVLFLVAFSRSNRPAAFRKAESQEPRLSCGIRSMRE